MLQEKDYVYYARILDDRLSLCQYRANNRGFFRVHTRQRPYEVYVERTLPQFNIGSQINAFSLYKPEKDYIFIMQDLVDFFAIVLQNASASQQEYTWMFHTILYFCGFHEFAHLYLGHCQLKNSCRMAMTFSDNVTEELSPKDIQAMEFEADMYAAAQLADLVREKIKNKEYRKLWGYPSKEVFYSHVLKALCGFFSIIKYLEYKEQKKRSWGKSKAYDHPSYLLREYLTGTLFSSLMAEYGFKRMDDDFFYYLFHTDPIFMHAPYDESLVKHDYSAILDGSIKYHTRDVLDYCNNVLDKKTAPFARLKACGTTTLKFE